MLGGLEVRACGARLAAPGPSGRWSRLTAVPTWIGVLLVLGAYLAPLGLGVPAFRPELQKGALIYRGLNTAVLAGFTVARVALAVTVLAH